MFKKKEKKGNLIIHDLLDHNENENDKDQQL